MLPNSRWWCFSCGVLGNRTRASSYPYDVPTGQAPQAFRESYVLRGAGQQMALQGFKLEPPPPKAVPGGAGIHKPRFQELFEKRAENVTCTTGTPGLRHPCREPSLGCVQARMLLFPQDWAEARDSEAPSLCFGFPCNPTSGNHLGI